jgi:amino acid permease
MLIFSATAVALLRRGTRTTDDCSGSCNHNQGVEYDDGDEWENRFERELEDRLDGESQHGLKDDSSAVDRIKSEVFAAPCIISTTSPTCAIEDAASQENYAAAPDAPANPSDRGDDFNHHEERQGTIASATFNMLSTMIGGGSLSLPLALYGTGNALVGPLMLVLFAFLTMFCARIHVATARMLSPPPRRQQQQQPSPRGKDTYESVASGALGRRATVPVTALVTALCFFGISGYAVLLRDMLQPITNALWKQPPSSSGPSLPNNLTMLIVVLVITPLCAVKTLTALQRFSAASMVSVLVVGACVLVRSVQCSLSMYHSLSYYNFRDALELLPRSGKDLLDAFPLYVSFFLCHYNLLPIHNDLQNPTPSRVQCWLRSTIWSATAFYMVLGVSGSVYGRCAAASTLEAAIAPSTIESLDSSPPPAVAMSGNILLDFPQDDPLLLVGRMCLALTLALALPMWTFPVRGVVLRAVPERFPSSALRFLGTWRRRRRQEQHRTEPPICEEPMRCERDSTTCALSCTLTADETQPPTNRSSGITDVEAPPHLLLSDASAVITTHEDPSFRMRLWTAAFVLWSASAVACCVSSIDVVLSLLGSSLSIFLSYLIPCAAYLAVIKRRRVIMSSPVDCGACSDDADGGCDHHLHPFRLHDDDLSQHPQCSKWLARALNVAFVPLMLLSFVNAVYNTFCRPSV